eukprot:TRINITY_DN5572_c0_g1_i1.p1 TRINITY_DN5572_c0_g1~~TRINITY_DN5572_c0_g1_i1.p1  ORF type:complete len:279 (+),score=119.05 TRINITY_DN5572_c0_g1_i1:231-1067(+)
MSVTGHMYNINATKKLNELELQEGYEGNRSWHHQFKDSAYVYIGGLHTGLTEGDVVIVFSQFGEIVDVNVIRDKATGKSKGFAFVCYEDQRSTILAVDNMNGTQLLNRTIRVDHVSKYKAPKKLDEENLDENGDPTLIEYQATGAEGKGHQVYNVTKSQESISKVQDERRAKVSKKQGRQDEDEAWAAAFEKGLADDAEQDRIREEKKALKKEMKEIEKMKKQAKKLKKEAKKAKKDKKKKKKAKADAAAAEGDKPSKKVKKEAKSSGSSSDGDSSSS